jgi:catechol 2,3-dioxygenase-like lactoylglutathione lyase family enzyme
MGGVQRFDHVGVVVDDLELMTAFFVDLGFERSEPMRLEGEWIDRVVGLDGVQLEMVSVNAPDGSGRLELTKFQRPTDAAAVQNPLANRRGFRHIAYAVDDLDSVVERLRGKGLTTIGDIVNYEDIFLLCYIGGPEGLIVELAQRIGDGTGQETRPD